MKFKKIAPFLPAKKKASLQESLLENPPLTLILGTVSIASKKDVIAYAKGIAESQLVAKEISYVDAIKVDGRWIYEIHEGGSAYSLAHWAISKLDFSKEDLISIPLSGSRVAAISIVDGEIATIIYPPDEKRHHTAVRNLLADERINQHKPQKLHPMLGSGQEYVKTGKIFLGISLAAFATSSAIYWRDASEFSVETKVTSRIAATDKPFATKPKNIPLYQLQKASKSIKTENGFIAYLKFEKNNWSFAEKPGAL